MATPRTVLTKEATRELLHPHRTNLAEPTLRPPPLLTNRARIILLLTSQALTILHRSSLTTVPQVHKFHLTLSRQAHNNNRLSLHRHLSNHHMVVFSTNPRTALHCRHNSNIILLRIMAKVVQEDQNMGRQDMEEFLNTQVTSPSHNITTIKACIISSTLVDYMATRITLRFRCIVSLLPVGHLPIAISREDGGRFDGRRTLSLHDIRISILGKYSTSIEGYPVSGSPHTYVWIALLGSSMCKGAWLPGMPLFVGDIMTSSYQWHLWSIVVFRC